MRPVTTASQNWRLLTLLSAHSDFPPCFPTFSLSGFGPSVSLSRPPLRRPLASFCPFYTPNHFPSRFHTSLPRSSQLHTSLPPRLPSDTFAYTEKPLLRDAPTGLPAAHVTMSSDSEDDMPLSRFSGRGKRFPLELHASSRLCSLGEQAQPACHIYSTPPDD